MPGTAESTAELRPGRAQLPRTRGNRFVLIAVASGFAMLALACLVATYLAWRNVQISDSLAQALRFHRATRAVQEALLAAEAGQRGFLLSGDPVQLQPYRAAQAQIPALLEQLDSFIAQAPARQAAAQELATLAQRKLEYLAGTVRLFEEGQEVAARLRTGEGRRLSEMAANAAGVLLAASESDVVHATAAHRRLSILLVLSIVLCLACAAGLAVLLLRDIRRQLRQLAGREARLHRLSATLDQRVAQRTRALTEAKLRFEVALGATGVTVATQDRQLVFTWISKGEFGMAPEDIAGRTDEQLNPDPSMAAVVAAKRGVLDSGQPTRREVRVMHDGAERWLDLSVQPTMEESGEVTGVITAAIDVTPYKEQETRIRLLMREVTHRSLNLLAVIEAIMRQTAANAASMEDFEARFSARLQSLAGSHDLLVQEDWAGASLRALVRSQLGHFSDFSDSQVQIEGPPLHIKPDAAQHIGMALHELATNAARYGALSVPDGKVTIGWKLGAGAAGGPVCQLTWEESGGPPVAPPSRRGFGRLVIERTVARAVQGEVKADYQPEGLRWSLTFPATYLATQ